jgi:hypothetical protein
LEECLRGTGHATDEGLTNVRQWYYGLPAAQREKFKLDMKKLGEASEPFSATCNEVKVQFHQTWYENREGRSITMKASLTPKEILAAIPEWDAADPDEQIPSLPLQQD